MTKTKKTIDLYNLVEFINWHCLDEKVFIPAKTLYTSSSYEVFWFRDINEPRWTIREKGEFTDPGSLVTSKELINELNARQIDLVDFQVLLINKILFHIAHLNYIVSKANDFFGSDLVELATEEVNDFYDNLQSTLQELLGGESTKVEDLLKKSPKKKSKPSLKVIKSTDEQEQI